MTTFTVANGPIDFGFGGSSGEQDFLAENQGQDANAFFGSTHHDEMEGEPQIPPVQTQSIWPTTNFVASEVNPIVQGPDHQSYETSGMTVPQEKVEGNGLREGNTFGPSFGGEIKSSSIPFQNSAEFDVSFHTTGQNSGYESTSAVAVPANFAESSGVDKGGTLNSVAADVIHHQRPTEGFLGNDKALELPHETVSAYDTKSNIEDMHQQEWKGHDDRVVEPIESNEPTNIHAAPIGEAYGSEQIASGANDLNTLLLNEAGPQAWIDGDHVATESHDSANVSAPPNFEPVQSFQDSISSSAQNNLKIKPPPLFSATPIPNHSLETEKESHTNLYQQEKPLMQTTWQSNEADVPKEGNSSGKVVYPDPSILNPIGNVPAHVNAFAREDMPSSYGGNISLSHETRENQAEQSNICNTDQVGLTQMVDQSSKGPIYGSVTVAGSTASCITSTTSSPARAPSLHGSVTGTNLDAGRRKLEQFKRKKAAVMARKAALAGSIPTLSSSRHTSAPHSPSHEKADAINPENTIARASETAALLDRAITAENSASALSNDLNRVLRQLEVVDSERTELQREKANLLGEILSLKSALDAGKRKATMEKDEELFSTKAQIRQLEDELQNSKLAHAEEISSLTEQCRALESQAETLESQRAEYEKYAAELGSWGEALQAEASQHQEAVLQLTGELDLARKELESLKNNVSTEDDRSIHLQKALDDALKKLSDAEERCSLAEQNVAAMTTELHETREQIITLEQNLNSSKEEIDLLGKLNIQSPTGSQESGNHEAMSLRIRLAKAESALEKERTNASMLEKQLRDAESAAVQGSETAQELIDLRQRCETAENQVKLLKENIGMMDNSSKNDGMQALWEERLRISEDRANAAELSIAEMKNQYNAVADEISRLKTENESLRKQLELGSRGFERETEHPPPQSGIISSDQTSFGDGPSKPDWPIAGGANTDTAVYGGASLMGHSSNKQESYEQNNVFGINHMPQESNVQSNRDTNEYFKIVPQPIDNGMVTVFERENAQPVMNNDSIQLQHEHEAQDFNKPIQKRRVGFWGWLAGADLVDEEEELAEESLQ